MKERRLYFKKIFACFLALSLVLAGCSSGNNVVQNKGKNEQDRQDIQEQQKKLIEDTKEEKQDIQQKSTKKATEIVAELSVEEKAAQMVQPACYNITPDTMEEYNYGSVLSKDRYREYDDWMSYILSLQASSLKSSSKIPFIYGQDDVHGVNYCDGAVIFPHNIGIGAANDEELTYQMGKAVADEAKLCGMLWNFSPCVAVATEPRWGRTYESYSSDVSLVKTLSGAYVKGMLEQGLVVCPKHFFADGSITYGSGEDDFVTDRGNAELSQQEIDDLLSVYQNLIDMGAQTIMISHSSLNGVKMHENAEYIGRLKNEMGFKGMIVSDWESIHHITGESLDEQVVNSINAGIDMLMEPEVFEECRQIIINAVNDGKITEERMNDAVTRIVQVKMDAGLFDDPLLEKQQTVQKEAGSKEYRELAEKLVEESLVLLKNENSALPLKQGAKIYLTGPALEDVKAQCGGWTQEWMGSDDVVGCTTILQGFEDAAEKYGFTIITDSDEAKDADVTILCVGEQAYAEWNGDTDDLSLTGALGLDGNKDAIEEAKELRDENNIPTVACIIAGRNVLINDYIGDWDAAVMCYLPGSEAQGIAHMLAGESDFKGKLPMPWYASVDQIKTEDCMFKLGYGLTYK